MITSNSSKKLPEFKPVPYDWVNHRAYVIAGGPSLIDFDFEKLMGRNTIAVKSVAEYLPWTDCYISMDSVPWKYPGRLQALKDANFRGQVFQAVSPDFDRTGYNDDHVHYLIRDNELKGLSLRSKKVRGHNSAIAGINLALLRGATTIYVLGFDLVEDGYWYDINNPNWRQSRFVNKQLQTREQYIGEMKSDLIHVADDAQRYGVEIIFGNVSPIPEIKSIPLDKI